jgi:Domain of unknown function (DUF4390)
MTFMGQCLSVAIALLMGLLWPLAAAAGDSPELRTFALSHVEDGLFLNYAVDLHLPNGAQEALNKAIPLFFVAEAAVYRERWYWRDAELAQSRRVWRVAYQPLTQTWRVSQGGLNQSFTNQYEALSTIGRSTAWKIAEASLIQGNSAKHYVSFNLRLDTEYLPRPMQIGISDQAGWELNLSHKQYLSP